MSENLKKFLEIVSKDKALQDKVKAFGSDREAALTGLIALAKEIGMELSKADFEAPEGELAEDELFAVSGGTYPDGYCECGAAGGGGTYAGTDGFCGCAAAGGGGGHMLDDGATFGCACVAYGQGGDGKDDHIVCICFVTGGGG